jgi:hypothetical protein
VLRKYDFKLRSVEEDIETKMKSLVADVTDKVTDIIKNNGCNYVNSWEYLSS